LRRHGARRTNDRPARPSRPPRPTAVSRVLLSGVLLSRQAHQHLARGRLNPSGWGIHPGRRVAPLRASQGLRRGSAISRVRQPSSGPHGAPAEPAASPARLDLSIRRARAALRAPGPPLEPMRSRLDGQTADRWALQARWRPSATPVGPGSAGWIETAAGEPLRARGVSVRRSTAGRIEAGVGGSLAGLTERPGSGTRAKGMGLGLSTRATRPKRGDARSKAVAI